MIKFVTGRLFPDYNILALIAHSSIFFENGTFINVLKECFIKAFLHRLELISFSQNICLINHLNQEQ